MGLLDIWFLGFTGDTGAGFIYVYILECGVDILPRPDSPFTGPVFSIESAVYLVRLAGFESRSAAVT